jgi:hypothetical protein
MFVVTEADTAAIRAAFDEGGELSADVALRRRFPGITDRPVRECAGTIALGSTRSSYRPSASL